MSGIEARGLRKTFGDTVAVHDLDLTVEPGTIYGLIGADGAGKTTTLRCLCGALEPDRGVVRLAGLSLADDLEAAREHLGYLSQRFSLYDELTVLENLRFFAEVRGLRGGAWQTRTMETLAFVGLDAFTHRQARHLSGGMRQKLGLAVALVHEPEILLLDEPTRGVDPVTRQDFWQLIIRLVDESSVTVLVSTAYMDEASRCTQVGLLKEGHLVAEGPPAELRGALQGQVLELRGRPLAQLRSLAESTPGVEACHTFGDRLHVRVAAGAAQEVLSRLDSDLAERGVESFRARIVPPQLEDVFIALLEDEDGG